MLIVVSGERMFFKSHTWRNKDCQLKTITENRYNSQSKLRLFKGGALPWLYTVTGQIRDGTAVRALASHQCGPGSIPSLDSASYVG